MQLIFAIGELARAQVDGLETVGAVPQKACGKQAQSGVSAEQVQPIFTPLSRSINRPTRFHGERFAALELEEGHAKILHIKRAPGIYFTLSSIDFSNAARAKFGLDLRAHRANLELLAQIATSIRQLHAHIESAAAA